MTGLRGRPANIYNEEDYIYPEQVSWSQVFEDLSDNDVRPGQIAELIGILLGDGYIDKKSKRVKISFNSKDDADYLDYVRKLIEQTFEVKVIVKYRKNENTAELFIFNKEFTELLTKEIGLKFSPKWNNAKIPRKYCSGDLALDVLRGYFDTDGCVVKTNNNGTLYPRLEMKISPSPMQNQFINILRTQKFSFGVYKIGKSKVRVQMNGKVQLKKWCNEVGFSNKKHRNKTKLFI